MGSPEEKKRLGLLRQNGVFSEQILRLRPQNDTNCSALLIFFIAIPARAPDVLGTVAPASTPNPEHLARP
jgi:hypothetical protein